MTSAFGVEHLAKGLSPGQLNGLRRAQEGASSPQRAYAFSRLERHARGQRIGVSVRRARDRKAVTEKLTADKLADWPRPVRKLP